MSVGERDEGHPDEAVLFSALPKTVRREQTQALMQARSSDISRWSVADNFHSNWKDRAEAVAALAGPGKTILDLGCGRMDLEGVLHAGCTYIPCDLVARDGRTHVCDLNAGQLPDAEADIVVMLGVLEYIHDPEALFQRLASRWRRLILTYNAAELDAGRDRLLHGWFNALTSARLVAMAENAGWRLIGIVPFDGRQKLFEFGQD
ncbi:class I SAM-dependent methyltransferase [Asticcacaulis solisilvae]|uniref:class I SAM-dependent methyltransferase n=1 Tax=Asticcacaulis solisilvae TaxID=1217274 RepID=UPI003FD86057